jgi:hypothetical protein
VHESFQRPAELLDFESRGRLQGICVPHPTCTKQVLRTFTFTRNPPSSSRTSFQHSRPEKPPLTDNLNFQFLNLDSSRPSNLSFLSLDTLSILQLSTLIDRPNNRASLRGTTCSFPSVNFFIMINFLCCDECFDDPALGRSVCLLCRLAARLHDFGFLT